MPSIELLDRLTLCQPPVEALEQNILVQVEEQAVIGLDALVVLMSDYSWSQIFHAVDRLARNGRIILRRHRGEYTIFSPLYAA